MGFFQSLKDDLSFAMNELINDESDDYDYDDDNHGDNYNADEQNSLNGDDEVLLSDLKDESDLYVDYDNTDSNVSYKNDTYGEHSYMDDSYEENSYKDGAYVEDSYKDDEYAENSYKNDAYVENSYKDDEYVENSYKDDTYSEYSYADEEYSELSNVMPDYDVNAYNNRKKENNNAAEIANGIMSARDAMNSLREAGKRLEKQQLKEALDNGALGSIISDNGDIEAISNVVINKTQINYDIADNSINNLVDDSFDNDFSNKIIMSTDLTDSDNNATVNKPVKHAEEYDVAAMLANLDFDSIGLDSDENNDQNELNSNIVENESNDNQYIKNESIKNKIIKNEFDENKNIETSDANNDFFESKEADDYEGQLNFADILNNLDLMADSDEEEAREKASSNDLESKQSKEILEANSENKNIDDDAKLSDDVSILLNNFISNSIREAAIRENKLANNIAESNPSESDLTKIKALNKAESYFEEINSVEAEAETIKPEVIITEEIVAENPIIKEPVVEEAKIEEAKIEEPIIKEPIIIEEVKIEEPIIKEPITEEAIIEEVNVDETILDEIKLDEVKLAEVSLVEDNFTESRLDKIIENESKELQINESEDNESIINESIINESIINESEINESEIEEFVIEEAEIEDVVDEEKPKANEVAIISQESLAMVSNEKEILDIDSKSKKEVKDKLSTNEDFKLMPNVPAYVPEISSVFSDETAIINKGMRVVGNVASNGNMEVSGAIVGDINIIGKLTVSGVVVGKSVAHEIFADKAEINGDINVTGTAKIGQDSVIIGNIVSTSAVIAGAVKGDIDVRGPVVIDSSAIIKGNIKSMSVQINNGAVIDGMCSQCYAQINPTSFFNDLKKSTAFLTSK